MAGISAPRAHGAAVTDETFLEYCRKLASGVTVVTSCGETAWAGTTVSTVTSVSRTPPIVLFCLGTRSRTLRAIRYSGRFAAHLLSDEQPGLADRFSQSLPSPFGDEGLGARLAGRTPAAADMPVLSDVLAIAWCSVHSLIEVGDHIVVFGRLSDVWLGQGAPLVWHDRAYHTLESAGVRGAR
jgi:flavin reductase (DIM6/NTAB) family NADH-FMN oxidoreductase RutF